MILVCEADEGVQEAFRLMLAEWASVRVVARAAECFEILAHGSTALLILDLDRQAGKPLHGLRRLRLVAPDLTILLVAGAFTFDFQVSALRYSPVSFLTKPFDPKATVERMQLLTGAIHSSIRTRMIRIATTPEPVAGEARKRCHPSRPDAPPRADDPHHFHPPYLPWRDAVRRSVS